MPKSELSKTLLLAAFSAAFAAATGLASLAPVRATEKSTVVEQSELKGSGDGEARPTPPTQLPGADDEDKPKGSRGG